MKKQFTDRQTELLENLANELIATGELIQNNIDQGIRFIDGDIQYRYVQAKKRFSHFKSLLNLTVEGK